jgi:hypothetical protein
MPFLFNMKRSFTGKIPEIFGAFYQAVENRGNTHKVLKPEFITQLDLLRDGLLQIFGGNSLVQQLLVRENFISLIALIGHSLSQLLLLHIRLEFGIHFIHVP